MKWFIRLILKYCIGITISWVLFIAMLTLVPGSLVPSIIDWNFMSLDKIIHFTVFSTLGFLLLVSTTQRHGFKLKAWPIFLSLFLAMSYGCSLEVAQSFVPERGFDWADMSANIIGSWIGLVIFTVLRKIYITEFQGFGK